MTGSFDDVFFDCDSTLTAIEGVDELAARNGVGERVAELTNAAMNGALKLEDVYAERLRLIAPTREQVRAIADAYADHVVPDAREVVAELHARGKRVFVVSGGIAEAVAPFSEWLGVPRERIFGVPIRFDDDGRFVACAPSPLTTQSGKRDVIAAARVAGRTAMLVGDGASDLAAYDAVDVFVGFGGVVAREAVRAGSDVFVTTASLRPLLDLADGRLPSSGAIASADGRWHRARRP